MKKQMPKGGKTPGVKDRKTVEMVEWSQADKRLPPAKAMIEFYMMNLDAFPMAKAAFPGKVQMKLARVRKRLMTDMSREDFAALDWDKVRQSIEYDVLVEMFPAMPRVVAMKESAPYVHSKMPSMAQLDISDNRVAERIMNAQARIMERILTPSTQREEPHDVTPKPAAGSLAAVIGRAGSK